jgi:hypothetical protein
MITQLQTSETALVSRSVVPHSATMNAAPDDCRISEQEMQSGRRLRNLILAGNAVAWIVIVLVARALFF